MLRLIVAVLLTIVAVAFTLANTHHVPLSLIIGSAVHVRMIFLLMTAFIAGAVTTVLLQQIQSFKVQKQEKRRRRKRRREDEEIAEFEGA